MLWWDIYYMYLKAKRIMFIHMSAEQADWLYSLSDFDDWKSQNKVRWKAKNE